MSELINERNHTHGGIRQVSFVSQQIKSAIFDNHKGNLTSYQIEALEMIAHKMARILSGDPKFIDHWQDISGYAEIVVKELRNDRVEITRNGDIFHVRIGPEVTYGGS